MEPSTNGVTTNGHAETPSDFDALFAALESIDNRFKGGDWLDELERAQLLAEREQLYKGPPNDFIKDTAEKTGINRSVLQRVRRITRLPKEVMELLKGTKIADRQDLLVSLSDRVAPTNSLEAALAITKSLIENPPAYGPRSAKAAPIKTLEAPAVESMPVENIPEFGIEILEGLPIAMAFPDGKPRIQDLELGIRLGFGRARDIRKLIKDLIAGGFLLSSELCDQPSQTPRTTGRPAKEFWLDEEQALFVTTQARTGIAQTITRQVIRAFVEARRRLSKELQETWFIGVADLLKELQGRMTALESSSSFGTRPMLLVPQVDSDEAGYSMEALNKTLIEKGFNISENDTAIRSIAAKLKIIGDIKFGFWNAHNDRVNRSLSESWRFNDAGALAMQGHVRYFCELKMQNEESCTPAPRESALQKTLDGIALLGPIGTGEHEFLTRRRRVQDRQPFPGLRGPVS